MPVAPGVRVKYVDRKTREETIRDHPELEPSGIVEPDFIEDGIALPSIASGSQDFLVANHVLEHSPDPIDALLGWSRALKSNGVLFVAVPLVSGCFDRGRPVTELSHLVKDHELYAAGDAEALAERNLWHYREWLTVSEPNILKEQGKSPRESSVAEVERRAEKMLAESEEIHFHTFSRRSFRTLLRFFVRKIAPQLVLRSASGNRFEAIGILQRR